MQLHVHNALDDIASRPGLAPGDYVDRCLELANWRDDDNPNQLVTIPSILLTNADEMHQIYKASGHQFRLIAEGNEKDDPLEPMLKGGAALHSRLQKTLEGFLSRPAKARGLWRAIADSACQSVKVYTTLTVGADGVLQHDHRYIPMDHDGVVGLLLAFLMDPTKPGGGELRSCALNSCGRFFIARRKISRGGRLRLYCTPDHQIEADRVRARVRIRKHRERMSKTRGAKARTPRERK